ncbi:YaiI/YqxD family protein [Halalkalibacter oceani]|uniref:UPF0178 protein M3202_02005 n=1 Tax=Halalkalibacter oceani TaxID=1653776 RepID=A0A9X2DMT4_9BACI|nr:YaiI/YqxD family protein [Halalkalibacter oceani]
MLNSTTMNPSLQTLYVDADACPVKNEIIDTTQAFQLNVIFVSSYAHHIKAPSFVKIVTVDSEKEAVDLYVMNRIKKGDLCVTQDHALASILLAKGAVVLSPRGHLYLEDTIDQMLDARYVSQKQRRMGAKTKGPKAFTKTDRLRFARQLKEILAEKAGRSQKSSNV